VDARDLDYELPEDRIAQEPPKERDGARLLVLDRERGELDHRRVLDLPTLLAPALFVVNDTRVFPARLFARKPTGGRVEVLLVALRDAHVDATKQSWLALARGTKAMRPGMTLVIEAHDESTTELRATVRALREGGEVELELTHPTSVREAIHAAGHVPLPPYVRRDASASDVERYQTVFAAREGSVAAPTAGLHFSERLLAALGGAGHKVARVTLHVGPGTFAPLRADDLREHRMHAERFEVSHETVQAVDAARAEGRPVVAVGTTVCRTLESVAEENGRIHAGSGETALFIYPPYRFRVIDALVTNFHLPRSTLLALVMAFGGTEAVKRAYRTAVEEKYRFYSYGDAMLVRSARHAR
jgi:S-adenosylmethionine:tRNA ribosyltransferase-isomerase